MAGFEQESNNVHLVEIVPLQAKHLSSVMHIDTLTATRPWSKGLWNQELANKETRAYFVGEFDSHVVSFYGLMFMPDATHITTIAVHPEFQQQAIGTQLMLDCYERSVGRGFEQMSLEVRPSNTSAIHLYQEFGFVPAGVRKNYYPDTNEDALVMWAQEITGPAHVARIAAIRTKLQARAKHEWRA